MHAHRRGRHAVEGVVAIMEKESRSLVPWKGIAQLLSGPRRGRIQPTDTPRGTPRRDSPHRQPPPRGPLTERLRVKLPGPAPLATQRAEPARRSTERGSPAAAASTRPAVPRAVATRSPCHAARPVNPARMCHSAGEVAAADNRRCGRLGSVRVKAESPVWASASVQDSPNRDRSQPRLRASPRRFSPAWWRRPTTKHRSGESTGVSSCRRAGGTTATGRR